MADKRLVAVKTFFLYFLVNFSTKTHGFFYFFSYLCKENRRRDIYFNITKNIIIKQWIK